MGEEQKSIKSGKKGRARNRIAFVILKQQNQRYDL